MDHSEIVQRLAEVIIFESLNEGELKDIAQKGQFLTYKKDDVILFESDSSNDVYIILEGLVKISRTNKEFKEVILAILAERDFFGEMSALDEGRRSADVTSITKVHLLKLSQQFFLDLLEKFPIVSLALLREMVGRIRKTDHHLKNISLGDAAAKVASVLIRLADEVGRQRRGRVEIDSIASQQEMANFAATSRETISRVFSIFEKEGFIEREMNKIIITDFDAFKQRFGK
ncbi:MAG: Crp/Fnr family transcriptional regulator [Chlorobiales bacterium]|jgi:CRP/FNR family transcriptional regulator, cyclic AMP receptor protein|nr:Crp/Fnr family transcriptional regulator [Chlorobiales bacterium]